MKENCTKYHILIWFHQNWNEIKHFSFIFVPCLTLEFLYWMPDVFCPFLFLSEKLVIILNIFVHCWFFIKLPRLRKKEKFFLSENPIFFKQVFEVLRCKWFHWILSLFARWKEISHFQEKRRSKEIWKKEFFVVKLSKLQSNSENGGKTLLFFLVQVLSCSTNESKNVIISHEFSLCYYFNGDSVRAKEIGKEMVSNTVALHWCCIA